MMIEICAMIKYDDRCRLVYFLVLGLCMIKLMPYGSEEEAEHRTRSIEVGEMAGYAWIGDRP